MEIANIENLVKGILTNGKKLVSHQCRKLLPTGENYGSTMLLLKLKVVNEAGEEEDITCVAKTCPPPGFLWELFNTRVTFKKEIALYDTIVPTLNEFAREKGARSIIDFVSKCQGARLSLDPHSNEVDANAVLLMENLKEQGFDVGDRFTGYDLESSKLVLRNLATLHASVIAHKSTKPSEFQKKILPFLTKHDFTQVSDKFEEHNRNSLREVLAPLPEYEELWPKVETLFDEYDSATEDPMETKEIFRTLTHNDLWVNNTMLKYENGKAVANKMVDFQMIEHTSLANDVIFFLYTSVELSVLQTRLEELFKYYFDVFISTLQQLDISVGEYTFESMMDELAVVGKRKQFFHVITMLVPIMTLKGKATELSDLKADDILVEKESLHDNYQKRAKFVVLDFNKREWI